MGAPIVVAKGREHLAEKIIDIAKKNDIPVYQDPILSDLLINLDIYQEIPRSLYEAVAKAVAFCISLDEKRKKRTA